MLSRSIAKLRAYFVGEYGEPGELTNVILIGLDSAGKTTFLYKARNMNYYNESDVDTIIPTIGFNIEQLDIKKCKMTCWDIGGCDKIRPLWRHYTQGSAALILFVDSNDRDRIGDVKHEMDILLGDDTLAGVPLLVVANKQDLPNALTLSEIVDRLGLQQLRKRDWNIIPAAVSVGDGVGEIFEWIARISRKDRQGKSSAASSAEDSTLPPPPPPTTSTTKMTGHLQTKPSSLSFTPPSPASALDPAVAVAVAVADAGAGAELSWTERPDLPEEEFLSLLSTHALDIWDHYTHVRIAWVFINKYGIRDGFIRVEEAIVDFIANSARTDSRSFHATMTRFWCHMIAYSMELVRYVDSDYSRPVGFKDYIGEMCAPNSKIGSEVPLWDKTLFKRYYSSSAMFRSEVRVTVGPPDLLALPDIVPVLYAADQKQYKRDVDFLEHASYWRLQNVPTTI